MHTLVFGWFGASTVWFISLLWRVAKSILLNGGGLHSPGTIRLWLGFFCVLLASCTLEAALFHSFTFAADVDHLGHVLLLGLGGHAGVVSTPAALGVGAGAAAVFLISLPWLCEFQWRATLGWANGAFGLGLKPEWLTPRERSIREKPSRGRASRDKAETRGVSAGLGSFKACSPSAGGTTAGPRTMLRLSACRRRPNARVNAISGRRSGDRSRPGEAKASARYAAPRLRACSNPCRRYIVNWVRARRVIRTDSPMHARPLRATGAEARKRGSRSHRPGG